MQELKFGTETPIEYVEKELGITIGIKVFGKITFREEVKDEKKEMILSPFMKALCSKIKEYEAKNCSYANLPSMGLEINNYLEGILDALSVPGHVNIMGIMPDEASKKLIEAKTFEASPDAMAAAQVQAAAQAQAMAQTAAAAQTPAMTQTSTAAAPLAATITYKPAQAKTKRPKFCTNCGTPVGPTGNFCINCGTRLSGMI